MDVDSPMKRSEQPGSRVDRKTLGQDLAPDPLLTDVNEKQLTAAIKEMSESARRRVVFNFSGALPGPPRDPVTVSRRLLTFIEHIFDGR